MKCAGVKETTYLLLLKYHDNIMPKAGKVTKEEENSDSKITTMFYPNLRQCQLKWLQVFLLICPLPLNFWYPLLKYWSRFVWHTLKPRFNIRHPLIHLCGNCMTINSYQLSLYMLLCVCAYMNMNVHTLSCWRKQPDKASVQGKRIYFYVLSISWFPEVLVAVPCFRARSPVRGGRGKERTWLASLQLLGDFTQSVWQQPEGSSQQGAAPLLVQQDTLIKSD